MCRECGGWIGVAEGEPVGEKRVCERVWVLGGFGSSDETVRGGHRLVVRASDCQRISQGRPDVRVPVVIVFEQGPSQAGPTLRLADGYVWSAERRSIAKREPVETLVAL